MRYRYSEILGKHLQNESGADHSHYLRNIGGGIHRNHIRMDVVGTDCRILRNLCVIDVVFGDERLRKKFAAKTR